jgi:energy-coupling factor transporter ATP-binding protein EcfA2
MSVWDSYPAGYRAQEVQFILAAVQAGECVAVVGLSGAGKSNLVGFLANRSALAAPRSALIDCNRLPDPSPEALYSLICRTLGEAQPSLQAYPALESVIERRLAAQPEGVCLLFDRFDSLAASDPAVFDNLRALRDTFKYRLTYVTFTRRPLAVRNELAELFFANTVWLGPLSEADARWNISRYMQRKNQSWDEATVQRILELSEGYPAMLRATCEACAAGAALDARSLAAHPAVRRRVDEFWADEPEEDHLRLSGLGGHALLGAGYASIPDQALTAKEHLLLEAFRRQPNQVCSKDDLIRAVWPEDHIFERGVRDDSLAQLIRRLREKIEADPSHPDHILTVAGRGYRYTP